MKPIDIVLIIIICICVALAIWRMIKHKGSHCCGDCNGSSCYGCDKCKK